MSKEKITLQELIDNGLVLENDKIQSVCDAGQRKNDFYVGTNVKEWLESFKKMNNKSIAEKFGQENYNQIVFKIIGGDNSYNWGGLSSKDVQFIILSDSENNKYICLSVHIGKDIRAGYSNSILIDLQTDSEDYSVYILDNINESCNSASIEYEGVTYNIQGEISSEYLSVYSYETDDVIEIVNCVYCCSKEEYEKELINIVKEAIKKWNEKA